VARTEQQFVIAYIRCSTEEQTLSGLGLAAQRIALDTELARQDWKDVRYIEDAGRSGKDLNRPGISEALRLLAAGEASTLVVSKVDRLSRSLLDFSHLVALARKQGWRLVVLDLGVDTATPSGEMLANLMVTFAQYERRLAGERTSLALQAKKAAGHRLGRPRTLDVEVTQRIVLATDAGQSPTRIAECLNRDAVPTARGGKRWYPSTVLAVLRSARLDQEAGQIRSSAEISR
jgi:DNA invertase Pin-like site-specific DNA recombinase